MKSTKQTGQVGLVVLVVMVILFSLAISIITRSTGDIIQSRQEKETTRVFDAAEAGIEAALSQDLSTIVGTNSLSSISNIDVDYDVASLSNLDIYVDQGHALGVDVEGYTGLISIEWSTTNNCANNPASIIVTIFNSLSNTVSRTGYEGCSHPDSFSSSLAGSTYQYRVSFNVNANDQLIRIRPVYNGSNILVTGSSGFPSQQYTIDSTARNQTGNETRKVAVTRTRPMLPGIFDYVLFSGGTITK